MRNSPAREDFSRRLLLLARSAGVEQAEVYLATSRDLAVEVRHRQVTALQKSVADTLTLRVIRGGRVGYCFSNRLTDPQSVVTRAIENALFSEPDDGNRLPGPSEAPRVDVHDPAVADMAESDAVALAVQMEDAALSSDVRVKKIRKAAADFSETARLVMNSRGVNAAFASTKVSAQITVVAEGDQDCQMGRDYASARFLEDISFKGVGARAARKAVSLLGAGRLSPCKTFVLLENDIAADFLSVLSASFSYESILRRRSLFSGKTGKMVVSPLIDIVDNGTCAKAAGSRPVDAEGVPSGETVLVAGGVLANYLHNTYTAAKTGVPSTGNAFRSGWSGVPRVGVSNIFIRPASDGTGSPISTLRGAMTKGLCVIDVMGMHTANPVSGDFSVGVSGLWIEKGRDDRPVREAVISGNLLDFFKEIRMVGDDLRFYGNIGSPSLLIENVDISG